MEETKPKRSRAARGLAGSLCAAVVLAAAALPQRQAEGEVSATGRDQVRAARLYQIESALDAYFQRHNRFPTHSPDPHYGGWETSLGGEFLMPLVREGFLVESLGDPLDSSEYHFRYCVYGPSTEGAGGEPFFVLVATGLESPATFLHRVSPYVRGGRSWSDEFPLALGGP